MVFIALVAAAKPLLDARGKAPRVAETILVNGWGRPYTPAFALSHAIRREFVGPGSAKRGDGRKTYTMHGLRKIAASDARPPNGGTPRPWRGVRASRS